MRQGFGDLHACPVLVLMPDEPRRWGAVFIRLPRMRIVVVTALLPATSVLLGLHLDVQPGKGKHNGLATLMHPIKAWSLRHGVVVGPAHTSGIQM